MLELRLPLFGVRRHRAQLEQLEALTAKAEALLDEEGVARRLNAHGDHQQHEEGERDEQGQRGRKDVEQPLDHSRAYERPRRCDRNKQVLGSDRVQHASRPSTGLAGRARRVITFESMCGDAR